MDSGLRAMFEKQGYAVVGDHTAVKTCHWLRESIINKRVCYKQSFFGIDSHRCLQMSPSANLCNQRCLYCWRYQGSDDSEMKWDDPRFIVLVKIDKPRLDPWGAEVAAPVFKTIAERLFVLLDVPPDSVRLASR